MHFADGSVPYHLVVQVDKKHEGSQRTSGRLNDPIRFFLAEKGGSDSWATVTYLEALERVEIIAQALLERGLCVGDSLVILSGNSVKQALLTLAGMHIGVVVVPVSPAYSLMSADYKKLKDIVTQVTPSLIYVEDIDVFQKALDALGKPDIEVVSGEDAAGTGVTGYTDLMAVSATDAVREAFDKTGSDTIAKVLFTSGSTGVLHAELHKTRGPDYTCGIGVAKPH